jgi:hypothetical protein
MQQKQQKTLESYSTARQAAPLARFPQWVQLTEPLRICLLAVAHRYPKHSLDINEAVLGPQDLGAEGWWATDLIELLQETAPQLLLTLAHLHVTTQRRGIYLLDYSEDIAAFWMHCGEDGEKTPIHRGDLALRRAELAQRRDEALRVVRA